MRALIVNDRIHELEPPPLAGDPEIVDVHSSAQQGWVRQPDGSFGPEVEILTAALVAARVDAERDRRLALGYQHNFGGSAGIRTLDNRDETDAINWLGLNSMAEKLIAGGQGAAMLPIRDAGNETFTASAETVSTAMMGMAQWRAGILSHSWTLKDETAAAADEAALAAIDIGAGWP